MAKQAVSNDREPVHQASKVLEEAARASVDALLERTLTDAEWVRTRNRLLAFVNIIRSWDRATHKDESSRMRKNAGRDLKQVTH